MKKIYIILLMVGVIFTACKKNNDPDKEPESQTNKLVFFVDTFRVYSSDFEGNNLKAILDEDEKSGNNYISSIAYSQNNKFVYVYKPATGNMQIKVANGDGSNKKTLKTVSSNVSIAALSSFNGKILYTTNDYSSGSPVNELRSMNEDGSNDVKENLPYPSVAAKSGSAYISASTDYSSATPSSTFYVVKFKNGTWDEAGSFNLPKVTAVVRAEAISNDGNTFVYATTADFSSLTYDIYTVDISKKGNTAKKIATHTIPTTGEGGVSYPPQLSITFANETANVLIGYGINVDNQRYATKNDYYYIQNIDVAKGNIVKKWKISGEYGGNLLTN